MSHIKYRVDTLYDESKVEQAVTCMNDISQMTEEMSRQIIDLKEAGVRRALIELGWTPPKDA